MVGYQMSSWCSKSLLMSQIFTPVSPLICARTFLGTPVRISIDGGISHSREVVQRTFGIRLDGFSTLSPTQRADLAVFLL
jgi:hypothetical protein